MSRREAGKLRPINTYSPARYVDRIKTEKDFN